MYEDLCAVEGEPGPLGVKTPSPRVFPLETDSTRRFGTPRRYPILFKLVPAFLPWLGAALFSTVSIRVLNRKVRDEYVEAGLPFVGVLWHQHMLLALKGFPGRRLVFMSSRSRDGEISTQLLRRLGHKVVRGSSSQGGADALRRMTRLVREGIGAVMVADGPKGPARVAKLGCILAARDSGAPLLPVGCAISRAKELGSWDRTAIPYPLSRVSISFGAPIGVPSSAGREECEEVRARLDQEMARVEARSREVLERP